MTYSSAIFRETEDDLYKGQINKYRNLAQLIDVKSNDKEPKEEAENEINYESF